MHSLTRLASAWLGRDAWTGAAVEPPAGVDDLPDREAATAFPRGYGFHATLKAPFHLAAGRSAASLLDAVAAFAADWPPVPPVVLQPDTLGDFVALVPGEPAPALNALADSVVTVFEPFRAPLDPADRDRRLAGGLSERQREHLLRVGYPHVFEDFHFHMTLTGPVAEAWARDRYRRAFADYAGAVLAAPVGGWEIAVFHQPDRAQAFDIVKSWPLTGKPVTGQAAPDQSAGRSGS